MSDEVIAKALVGRCITAFSIASDRESITFTLKEGLPVTLRTDAD